MSDTTKEVMEFIQKLNEMHHYVNTKEGFTYDDYMAMNSAVNTAKKVFKDYLSKTDPQFSDDLHPNNPGFEQTIKPTT